MAEMQRKDELDAKASEIVQPVTLPLTDQQSEANFEAARKNVRQKHCSEPLPHLLDSQLQGKKCFERRRLWTGNKQESFDLPDELKCPTEDNVFTEVVKPDVGWKEGRYYQRSVSVPARLPDIVPEHKSMLESISPDLLGSKQPNPHLLPNTSVLSSSAPSGVDDEVRLEKERKQNFEGMVFCEHQSLPQELRRKKSVTFVISSKGMQARSHFRSSGYFSQSDISQASQASNISSEQGSLFSEDGTVEKSFDASNDPAVDGNIDSDEGEGCGEESKAKAELLHTSVGKSSTVKPLTPEQIDDTEMWSRQNCPSFHYGDLDVPNLSIFELTKESGDSDLCSQSGTSAVWTDSRSVDGESADSKSSPMTKEECQRELYKRLFEERMLKFDPSKESISDLLEWVKKNIGEALTPSPKSPFFPAEKSPPQQVNSRITPAVTSAMQTLGMAGRRDQLAIPHLARNQTTAPPLQLSQQHQLQQQHVLPCQQQLPNQQKQQWQQHQWQQQQLQNQQRHEWQQPQWQQQQLQNQQKQQWQQPQWQQEQLQNQQKQQWQQSQHMQQQQKQPLQHCTELRAGGGSVDVCRKQIMGPSSQTQAYRPAPHMDKYQHDLPATLDDVMLSMESSSGSERSHSLRPSLVEQLVQLSQCSYRRCTDNACVQAKKGLRSLQKALKSGFSHMNADDLQLLSLLMEHYGTCELINCPVPWCRYIFHCYQGGRTSKDLMKLFSSPLLTLLPSTAECQFDVFVKLDKSLPRQTMPQEWTDWLTLYSLSLANTVVRVTPLLPIWPHTHWVVKVASLHESRNQLRVYEKLRDLCHTHIISHIWMAASFSSDILLVCTQFLPGTSVRDLLDQHRRLSSDQSRHYWLQLLSAAQHLHQLHIVFLNWTCENVLVDESGRTVKVTNFTASVELSSGSADRGDINLTLPGDIVPAELLVQGGELTPKTDSWGLACVLHEMLIGTRPWYHLRHCSLEYTWLQILKQVPPCLSSDLPVFPHSTIKHCLQKSPDCRPSVTDMMERCPAHWF